MAQVGRISGPLLKSNLERNGIDLAFKDVSSSTPTLFLDVNNNRIGVNTQSPIAELQIDSLLKPTDTYSQQQKLQSPSFGNDLYAESVSIDGETYRLPEPFFVIATQNPMDSSGTSSLPDSQLDRFMISFSLSELSE